MFGLGPLVSGRAEAICLICCTAVGFISWEIVVNYITFLICFSFSLDKNKMDSLYFVIELCYNRKAYIYDIVW